MGFDLKSAEQNMKLILAFGKMKLKYFKVLKVIPNLTTASILTIFYKQGFSNKQYLPQTNAVIIDRSNVYVGLMMATR
jgi:hypothetical protein